MALDQATVHARAHCCMRPSTKPQGCNQRPINIAGKVLVLSMRRGGGGGGGGPPPPPPREASLGNPFNYEGESDRDPVVASAADCCAACHRTDHCNACAGACGPLQVY